MSLFNRKPTPVVRPVPFLNIPTSVTKRAQLQEILKHRKREQVVTDFDFEFNGATDSVRVWFPTQEDKMSVFKEIQGILKG